MPKLYFTILLIAAGIYAHAQGRVEGEFDVASKTFKSTDASIWIDAFEHGAARFSKGGGHVGVLDSTGKILVEPICDAITDIEETFIGCMLDGVQKSIGRTVKDSAVVIDPPVHGYNSHFVAGFAQVVHGDEHFVMDKSGRRTLLYSRKDVIDGSWYRGSLRQRTQAYFVVPCVVNGVQKYYYRNNKFKRISKLNFDYAQEFVKDHAVVIYKGIWGILDSNGVLLKTRYDYIEAVENGTFIVQSGERYGVVNARNEPLLPIAYAQVGYVFEGLYAVSDDAVNLFNLIVYNSYVIDLDKKEIVKYPGKKSDETQTQEECYFIGILQENLGFCFHAEKITDKDAGRILGRFHEYSFSGHVYFFDKHGLISDKGYYIETDDHDYHWSAVHRLFGGPEYERYSYGRPSVKTSAHLALKKVGNRFSIVEFNGYDGFLPLGNERFIAMKYSADSSLTFGLVNIDNKILVPLQYDDMKAGIFNRLPVKRNDKWGVIDYGNKVIIPFSYDTIAAAPCGFAVAQNGIYGFLDSAGNEIIR